MSAIFSAGNLALLATTRTLAEIAKDLPPDQAREFRAIVAASVGVLILSFALVGLAWWTLRRLRRRLRTRLGPSQPIQDAWYRRAHAGDSQTELDEPRP